MNSRDGSPSREQPKFRALLCIFLFAAVALFTTIAGCGGRSSASTSPSQGTPPSSLTYPQTTITATAGQAITADTPTVTGSVTTYSVNPALPAGLSLNPTSGQITGTPTGVAAQATYTITATNSAGNTTATIQITVSAAVAPPSSLTYPQTTITATVGMAITADTPSVTGTVSSYSVNPALPAGLSLSSTTGAISGTPTVITAQATYTVTATNSAGTTTAAVQITVAAAIAPPANLVYPETSIVTSVGQTIAPDLPIISGGAVQFTVSPALPAGISINSLFGAINGTGTAPSPQTTYTITASNAAGSVTATVTITMNKALPILLDVGHATHITQLRVTAARVLSQDFNNHWALWDYTTNPTKEIISGDQAIHTPVPGQNTPTTWPVDMAGQIFVIGQANGVDIRAVSDGHLIIELGSSEIDSAQRRTWWKLASDGSYICFGSQDGLYAWSSTGQPLFARPGDYSAANAYAAPGQVLVALGPAGQNVIETVSAVNGISSPGPAFSGTFNSWFTDGQRFFTNTGNTVYTYSATSAQQSVASLPMIENLTGQGNWFWTYQASTPSYPLSIYPVGGSTLSVTFNLGVDTVVVPSANTIGVLPYGTPSASVVDLSGSTPVKADYPLPIAYEKAYAATSASQWITGNQNGVVLDGTSASTTPRYFGTGEAWSIAGSANYAAVATASGQIFFYSPSSSTISTTPTTPAGTIGFSSSKVALSSDGTVMVAMADTQDAQYETDRTLNVYSLPSASLTYSIPRQYVSGTSNLYDFSLSGSGTWLGQVLGTSSSTYTRQVAPNTTGATPIWMDHPLDYNDGINLSPDGTLIAVSNGPITASSTTTIYKNGTTVSAVPGFPIGWIDNNQLLVKNYSSSSPSPAYSGSAIYDATGTLTSTPTLPELYSIQPVTSNSIYVPGSNQILSLPSGTVTYSSTTPLTGAAAVSGGYVVFASGNRVVVDTH